MGGHVFISYGRTDRPYVQRLAAHLAAAGIPVWYDYELAVGERFASVLQSQIDTCDAFLVVLTPASVESPWLYREISYAVHREKPVLPILLRRCDPHLLLSGLHQEDVTDGQMPGARFLERLRTLSQETADQPAVRLVDRGGRRVFGPRDRFRMEPDVIDAAALDRAADALAAALRVQWEAAANDRRLLVPTPVPVRWRWSELPLTGSIRDAVRPGTGRGFPALPGLTSLAVADMRAGGLHDLFGVYGAVSSGRLIVVGEPGAGKSSAAIMLVLDALAHRAGVDDRRRAAVPVPVLMTCHGWDPATQPLRHWLTGRLAAEYPFLTSRRFGADAPAALVRDGRVALVVDGLDELPVSLRPVALQALNEQATSIRLVVLGRSRELVDASVVAHLHQAAAVELLPVTSIDAADYLVRCRVHPPLAGWQRLVEHVRGRPDSVVTAALDSPLMLALARDTFADDARAEALLASGRFVSREQVEDELLDGVVPAAYADRPGQPVARYTVEQVTQWLGFLARRMGEANTRDLAWWRIATWTPAAARMTATALAAGLLALSGFGAAFWLAGGPVFGLAIGAGLGLGFGLSAGLVFGRGGREPQRFGSIQWSTFASVRPIRPAVVAAVAGGLPGGLAGGRTFGLVVGAAVGLSFWFAVGLLIATSRSSTDTRSPIDPITCWRHDSQHGLVLGFTVGLLTGLACGIGVGLGSGLLAGAAAFLVVWSVAWLVVGMMCSQTWPARLSFVQLRRSAGTPIALMRFLADAHARHVLRTAGPVYQFRHARLQDRLAGGHTNSPSRTPE